MWGMKTGKGSMLPSISQKGGADILSFDEGGTMKQNYRRRRRSGVVIGHKGGDDNASKSLGREANMLSTRFRQFEGRDLDAGT